MPQSNFYQGFLDAYTEGAISLTGDLLGVMLLSAAYKPAYTTDTLARDIDLDEIKGKGYAAGGKRLTGVRWEKAGASRSLHADNVDWQQADFSARYAVVYRDADTRGNLLVCCLDFEEVKKASGGPFLVEWPKEGIFTVRTVAG